MNLDNPKHGQHVGGFRRWARTMLAHRRPDNGIHQDHEAGRAVYQTSTMGALLDGIYDGDVTIAELLRHGDFGLGTFNHLDGEMLVLDGVCYRLRADGTATAAGETDRTPFATVTWFQADTTLAISVPTDRAALAERIDESLQSRNLIVAVRANGHFSRIHTRTVTEQHKPYPPLTEATSGQREATFTDVDGTVAGFRMPDYEQGISVAGYHLHYIDAARHRGGHAFDFELERGTVEISVLSELHLSLPRTPQFLQADLDPADVNERIRRTEDG